MAEVTSVLAAVEVALASAGLLLVGVLIGVFRVTSIVGTSARARTTSIDGRAGHRVVLHAAPDAEVERGVVPLVTAWELDGILRVSIATTGDLDLGASGFCQYSHEQGLERDQG